MPKEMQRPQGTHGVPYAPFAGEEGRKWPYLTVRWRGGGTNSW